MIWENVSTKVEIVNGLSGSSPMVWLLGHKGDKIYPFITGKCLTPTQLLICSSFSRENGHPLLICSSLSTAQIREAMSWKGMGFG